MKKTANFDLFSVKKIIEHIPHFIFWKDVDSTYCGCNLNFARFVGLTETQEIIGKTDYDLPWGKNGADTYLAEDREIINTKRPLIEKETCLITTGGTELTILVNKVPLFDEYGNITGILGIYSDISERKNMEQALIEEKILSDTANRLKTEFLENMRHDIRTPLSGIIGFSNLIRSEVKDKKIREYAENLTISSHTLMDFLNEVLESLRAISGEIPLLKQKFDLKAKLEHIIQMNKAKAGEKQLKLELKYDKKIPHYLIGDGKRIYRILLELVTNALKFTHKGNIKISAELARKNAYTGDTVLMLQVSDSGIGIPKSKQTEIFTRFHRLTPAFKGTYKGLGMGLTIVKQFIDDLEAEIYVESEEKKGTIFTCVIPLKEALLDQDIGVDRSLEAIPIPKIDSKDSANFSKLVKPKSVTSDSKSRILLVEDQPFAAQVVHDMLGSMACQVDIAENGKSALKYLKKNEYDLIFMDVGLPDIDGCEVTERVRLKERGTSLHLPIIALTAHIDVDSKQRCVESGMDAVLTKPLGKEKAQDILNAFIPHRKGAQLKKEKTNSKQPKITDNDLLSLDGAVIDLDLGAKIMESDHKSAKKMISFLLESAKSDMKDLSAAYERQNWTTIRELAHKLRGGAAYCGTPRLYQALSHLNDYLKLGKRDLAKALYQQAVTEMEKVKKEFKP